MAFESISTSRRTEPFLAGIQCATLFDEPTRTPRVSTQTRSDGAATQRDDPFAHIPDDGLWQLDCCESKGTPASVADCPESPEHDAPLQTRPASACHCLFCEHDNPTGAKFCNDCAAPLHLKLCKQCDAINDLHAANCYKCSAQFPARADASSTAHATDFAFASLAFGDIEPGHSPLPQRASEARDLLPHSPNDDFPAARTHDVDAVVRQVRRLMHGAPSFSHNATPHVIFVRRWIAAVQRSHVARVALATLLVAALVLSGGYLYGDVQFEPADSSIARTPSSTVLANTEPSAAMSGGTVRAAAQASCHREARTRRSGR